jgi:4-amino-4-deoxy-L-arabinose transferase-like glycosyltransferase
MHVPIQDFIHKLEMGGISRMLRHAVVFIAMLGVAVWYDLAAFRNLPTPEGMDAAQLARNLAEGRGYTTHFIRPFSIHLRETHRAGHDARLSEGHPDLANPPLYPLLLAVALKLMPFEYPDLSQKSGFSVYLPDLWIALFNQALLLLAVVLVFRLGKRLFDEPVAWVAAATVLGAELFWRFSVSGLSTLLLMVIFLALVSALARLEPAARGGESSTRRLIVLAVLAGALTGLAGLTRYAFGWLIVPVALWLGALPCRQRLTLAGAGAAAFLLVMGPWVTRNLIVSGTPFGTAGYAVCQSTSQFVGTELERSLQPSFTGLTAGDFTRKLVVNARELMQSELPRLGGSWVTAFFLVGLLVPFRHPTLGRLRSFVLSSLAVLAVAQALGRTWLSAESPEINSENLLVVLAPVVFLYGVSLFFVLAEQFGPKAREVRYVVMGLFVALACAPLALAVLPPRPNPVVYPPYYPPWIQGKARAVPEGSLMMTDAPWATAWYGRRPSVWLTLKYQGAPADRVRDDFYAVHRREPVRALYLTARTLKTVETQTLWQWIQDSDNARDWEGFVWGTCLKREVPTGFPLRHAPFGLEPEIFLTESERDAPKTIKSQ